MSIPTPNTSQPTPIVIVSEGSISTVEEVTYFGDDAVVSLGEYFWRKTEKAVVKKGSKRSREWTIKQGSVPNQIIWKRASTDVKQEALVTVTTMGAFAGANYNSVSSLNKEIEMKKREL